MEYTIYRSFQTPKITKSLFALIMSIQRHNSYFCQRSEYIEYKRNFTDREDHVRKLRHIVPFVRYLGQTPRLFKHSTSRLKWGDYCFNHLDVAEISGIGFVCITIYNAINTTSHYVNKRLRSKLKLLIKKSWYVHNLASCINMKRTLFQV